MVRLWSISAGGPIREPGIARPSQGHEPAMPPSSPSLWQWGWGRISTSTSASASAPYGPWARISPPGPTVSEQLMDFLPVHGPAVIQPTRTSTASSWPVRKGGSEKFAFGGSVYYGELSSTLGRRKRTSGPSATEEGIAGGPFSFSVATGPMSPFLCVQAPSQIASMSPCSMSMSIRVAKGPLTLF